MRDAPKIVINHLGGSDMESPDRVFRTPEAAKYIGIKTNTLEGWRSKNKGPKFHRIGRLVIYFKEDLNAFLEVRGIQTLDSINLKK